MMGPRATAFLLGQSPRKMDSTATAMSELPLLRLFM